MKSDYVKHLNKEIWLKTSRKFDTLPQVFTLPNKSWHIVSHVKPTFDFYDPRSKDVL